MTRLQYVMWANKRSRRTLGPKIHQYLGYRSLDQSNNHNGYTKVTGPFASRNGSSAAPPPMLEY